MIFTHLLVLTLAPVLIAQDLTSDHNTTSLTGTWSSGSKAVLTGSGFANPVKQTFNYPPTTGISFSFTDDFFYEIARYRFNSNGSEPTCITGVMNWVHGTYILQPNGSITMTPTGSDGYQQIQDPCGAISNFIEPYNDTELYQQWRIYTDPQQGFKLHLFQFDGSPLAPQFLVSPTPNMLPTGLIRNTTSNKGKAVLKRELTARSSAAGQHLTVGVMGLVLLSLTSVLVL
ncbi:Chaperone for protein-folding within the ER, fungal domain containing protein [Amanita muscaria]|uniref:Protein ROT1 n=1 Tax=Amanita muscaria (strain Koide BX008) TaxID=946122 RepID=A0A0C2TL18_AMAMK|nr:hypothetical protein M378DRAFT_185373 [Amanita muscaria Koide BX008]